MPLLLEANNSSDIEKAEEFSSKLYTLTEWGKAKIEPLYLSRGADVERDALLACLNEYQALAVDVGEFVQAWRDGDELRVMALRGQIWNDLARIQEAEAFLGAIMRRPSEQNG